MEGEQGSLNGRREVIRGELRRNVMGQLKDQIYLEDEQLYEQIDTAIRQKGKETYLPLKERLWLRNSLYDSFRRLDILQELLDDKDVTEIMINGAGKIFIEKKGNMVLWNRRFEKTEQLEDIIQQIVGKVNRIVNVSSPIADARLEDGSRVHIVLPPVALDGPVVTIRKFPDPITIEKLIRFQALTEEAAQFLEQLVKAKYNLFVCGGTNSGKTTFLNALSSFIPETERVITIEDSAELQITHVHHQSADQSLFAYEPLQDHCRGSKRGRGLRYASGYEYRPSRFFIYRSRQQSPGYAFKVGSNGAYGSRAAFRCDPQPDRVGP